MFGVKESIIHQHPFRNFSHVDFIMQSHKSWWSDNNIVTIFVFSALDWNYNVACNGGSWVNIIKKTDLCHLKLKWLPTLASVSIWFQFNSKNSKNSKNTNMAHYVSEITSKTSFFLSWFYYLSLYVPVKLGQHFGSNSRYCIKCTSSLRTEV